MSGHYHWKKVIAHISMFSSLNTQALQVVCSHLDLQSIVALAGVNKRTRSRVTKLSLCITDPVPLYRNHPQGSLSVVPWWLRHMTLCQRVIPLPHHILSVNWCPRRAEIACCLSSFEHGTWIFDANTGQALHIFVEQKDYAKSVSWSPDGNKIVVGAYDSKIRVWDTHTGRETLLMQVAKRRTLSVVWSPHGTQIACGGSFDKSDRAGDIGGLVWIRNATTGEEMCCMGDHTDAVQAVSWSPDGAKIASASSDKTVRIWNVKMGTPSYPLQGHHRNQVNDVHWSLDGSKIASASDDKTIRIWDTWTGKLIRVLKGHNGIVYSIRWSPDSTKLASCSADKTIRIWNAQTGKEMTKLLGHSDGILVVCWSTDGTKVISGSYDNTVRIWKMDV